MEKKVYLCQTKYFCERINFLNGLKTVLRSFWAQSDSKPQDVTDSRSTAVQSIKESQMRHWVSIVVGVHPTDGNTSADINCAAQPELLAEILQLK